MVVSKYPGAPTGEAGLHSILNSRTKSSDVTCRVWVGIPHHTLLDVHRVGLAPVGYAPV